jgi:hypothetical protein
LSGFQLFKELPCDLPIIEIELHPIDFLVWLMPLACNSYEVVCLSEFNCMTDSVPAVWD